MDQKKKSLFMNSNLRSIAWMFLLILSFQIVLPLLLDSPVYAGGPTQPEVQSFSPIGVTDMVDPFTGDFHYNIPLMDVEGYPVNLIYNSGVSMEQEASWVGLGWNLNTGAVIRNMRGLPDDFNGDEVNKELNQKPNVNVEVGGGADVELFGYQVTEENGSTTTGSGGLNVSMTLNYSNYNGFGASSGLGSSYSFAKSTGASGNAGFQLNGSSENGASWSASANFSNRIEKDNKLERSQSNSLAIGGSTRGGLENLSFRRTNYKSPSNDPGQKPDKGYDRKFGGQFNLGLHHYSPTTGPNMRGTAINISWKFPAELFGTAAGIRLSGSFSKQWIPDELKSFSNPAYGFFALEKGQHVETALMDFNRDNDGTFTKYTPYLPSAHLTPDLFSVQAHGIDGSFRGFRNDIGFAFDPTTRTINNDGGISVETGLGENVKAGVNVSYSHIHSESGAWDGLLNLASNVVSFEGTTGYLEPFSMGNSSEMSVDDNGDIDNFGTSNPLFFKLAGIAALPIVKRQLAYYLSGGGLDITDNNRTLRYKRNQSMYFRTVEEVSNGMGIAAPGDYPLNSGAKPHHIGEVTELATDGRRYVFGLPVYNSRQEDVTFAVGDELNHPNSGLDGDNGTGLVDYSGHLSLASLSNNKGIDHYYSSSVTPPYAHSFMLTSILSDDYIDADGVKGPSTNDLGSYVKFGYDQVQNFQWRTPIQTNTAYYNQGLKTDPTDDKASFIAGTKDLMYVHIIETKNYVAVLKTSDVLRADGQGAVNRHGGVTSAGANMKKLEKISLYSRPEYEAHSSDLSQATPIQEVNFTYASQGSALCPGYPNGGCKLTLTGVYFTYQHSQKMQRSGYTFEYGAGDYNPDYNIRNIDRWGNYQPQADEHGLVSNDFPYTRQNKEEADKNAAAWLLNKIHLPSGGTIDITYESDDYAYVQNLPAMSMFKIAGVEGNQPDNAVHAQSISDGSPSTAHLNRGIYFKMLDGHHTPTDYVKPGDELYFRCLVDFKLGGDNDYEYISGYGEVASVTAEGDYALVRFNGVKLKDSGDDNYSPITKAALQFGRMHMSRYINDINLDPPSGEGASNLLDFANGMIGMINSFKELFVGPNLYLYGPDGAEGKGRKIKTQLSWIRLKEPTGHKLGGGARVKKIEMFDQWDAMAGGQQTQSSYGQSFSYLNTDGTSSGVASYEPQIGGDENPWRTPVKYANKKVFATDDQLYMETPLMESQFPNPEIGYSRVVIEDLNQSPSYDRTNTGHVIKEFYTAKDFPTIVSATDIDLMTMNSFLPVGPKYQYLTASQGFAITLNDMHGKPKSEQVYSVGGSAPISRVDYFYKTNGSHLENTVQVINKNGQIEEGEIGVRREVLADFRRNETTVSGGAMRFNIDGFVAGAPILVPTAWPSVDISDNQFRSATLNKVINKFGILERTTAKQDGSVVETRNMAYDKETGEVLVTQTTTDFNDAVYSVNFPAYWMYPQIAAAYQNINYFAKPTAVTSQGLYTVSSNYFKVGDEVEVRTAIDDHTVTYVKGWVVTQTSGMIKVVDKAGDPIVPAVTDFSHSPVTVTVVRSGARNKQTASMASITTLNDPIANNSIGSGSYTDVLNAGAIEFGDNWRTYCNCFDPASVTYTTNPYVLGTAGNWRPVKSLTYLTGRSQTNFHGNTNIRKDGVFNSFTPYYINYPFHGARLWVSQPDGWTYVSEVTEFSPNGMTLETRDALGRYSSSKFGFNNTLTTAVAANTRLRQLEYASFEDNQYTNCTDQQLFATDISNISETESHSGHKSIIVQPNVPVVFGVDNSYCAPEGGCNLQLSHEGAGQLSILNGTGPYTLETQLLAGSGNAVPGLGDTVSLSYDSSKTFEIVITLHDSNGCTVTYKFVDYPDETDPNLEQQ